MREAQESVKPRLIKNSIWNGNLPKYVKRGIIKQTKNRFPLLKIEGK